MSSSNEDAQKVLAAFGVTPGPNFKNIDDFYKKENTTFCSCCGARTHYPDDVAAHYGIAITQDMNSKDIDESTVFNSYNAEYVNKILDLSDVVGTPLKASVLVQTKIDEFNYGKDRNKY
ncbi:MAG TPA: hypothetical protein VFM18_11515 [Methanosarcina sp.]|nr:hypothetical protein [Methanosarcina sp.]